jgi:hypothetical protein
VTLDQHQSRAVWTDRTGNGAREAAGGGRRYTGSHAATGVPQGAAGSFGS